MSQNAIIVENLAKRFLIGHQSFSPGQKPRYTALRDVIGRELRNFSRKTVDVLRGRQVVQGDDIEEFWALKDINFEVKQGEVLGIVGRNGAGKSTLLKILSRITEPSAGRVLLRGRVSSLLEVGTGFHNELSGRENIFLNGAILGMTQREIKKKFDEIVSFAEVEKFLDTPVKHFSSGMYVRLAFAVAAHLEPEILIVDEVLAVGDTEFQKKCLGKMNDFSRSQGRTVLFVSHNLEAVLKLCTRAILLEDGNLRAIGDCRTIVSSYLHAQASSPRVIDLLNKPRTGTFPGKIRLAKVSPSGSSDWSIPFGEHLSFDLWVDSRHSVGPLEVLGGIYSAGGFEIASWSSNSNKALIAVHSGLNAFRIRFQQLQMLPGRYSLAIALRSERGYEDAIQEAIQFDVITSAVAAEINADLLDGAVLASPTVSVLN